MGKMKNVAMQYPGLSGELALVMWYLDYKLNSGRECKWDDPTHKAIYMNTLNDIKDYIETMA
jgi:hypothetical protein